MDSARIAELLRPYLGPSAAPPSGDSERSETSPERSRKDSAFPSASDLQYISTYIDILLRWNARINLTAIRDPEEIVARHFGESLFAACHLYPGNIRAGTAAPGCPAGQSSVLPAPVFAKDPQPSTNDRIDLLDLGAGAGFPGIPIKLWATHLRVTLIESNQKKATFLREVIRALTLTDINVFGSRAEIFPGRASVVTLRAVERFEQALPLASSLVAPQGRLALLIGSAQLPRAQELAPFFQWQEPISIPGSTSRVLLLGMKG